MKYVNSNIASILAVFVLEELLSGINISPGKPAVYVQLIGVTDGMRSRKFT